MKIRYKIVYEYEDGPYSYQMLKLAGIHYRVGKWVTSPEWLRKKGYYPFVFKNYAYAEEFLATCPMEGYKIYRVAVKGAHCLLRYCAIPGLRRGEIIESPGSSFPRGTEMWEKVKLLEEVKS